MDSNAVIDVEANGDVVQFVIRIKGVENSTFSIPRQRARGVICKIIDDLIEGIKPSWY